MPFPHTTPVPDQLCVISLHDSHIVPKRSIIAVPSPAGPGPPYTSAYVSPQTSSAERRFEVGELRTWGAPSTLSRFCPQSGDCFSSIAHTTVLQAHHRPSLKLLPLSLPGRKA